jgi:hypothetical protein
MCAKSRLPCAQCWQYDTLPKWEERRTTPAPNLPASVEPWQVPLWDWVNRYKDGNMVQQEHAVVAILKVIRDAIAAGPPGRLVSAPVDVEEYNYIAAQAAEAAQDANDLAKELQAVKAERDEAIAARDAWCKSCNLTSEAQADALHDAALLRADRAQLIETLANVAAALGVEPHALAEDPSIASRGSVSKALEELGRVVAERDACREVLRSVESLGWRGEGMQCPVCLFATREGHADDCELARALGGG